MDPLLLGIVATYLLLALFLLVTYPAVSYVTNGLAFSRLARKRGISRPWLAWVPVAGSFLTGKIADDINRQYRKKTHMRVWMVAAQSLIAALSIAMLGVYIRLFLQFLGNLQSLDGDRAYELYASSCFHQLPWLVIPLMLVTAGYLVLFFISMNTIYREYASQKAGNYLVTALLFCILLNAPFVSSAIVLVISGRTPQFQTLNQTGPPGLYTNANPTQK